MSLPRYKSYKNSHIDWLGAVPAHWEVKAIKWLSPVFRGASPRPIDDPKYFDINGEYAWVRIADVSASDGILNTTTQRLSAQGSTLSVKLEPGSLFVSIAGTVGKPCVTGIKACIHDGFVYFPRLRVDQRLLYRIFEAGICYGGLGKFGTQLNLNTDTIGSIRVAIPPDDELQGILSFLDSEIAKIDALISEQRRLIELLNEKRSAVVSKLVTKGLNPNTPTKDSGVAWIGRIPAHWSVSRLQYIAKSGTSITYGIVQAGPHIENGIPYIKTSDMSGDVLPLDGYSKTSPEIDASYTRSKVSQGDLVIAIRATVGKCLPVPKELDGANLTQGTAKLSPGTRVRSQFLLRYINSLPVQAYLSSASKGATFKEITLETLRKTPVLVPPLNEQCQIEAETQGVEDKLKDLIAEAGAAEALLLERRRALISAAVTGKIDVRAVMPSRPEAGAAA
jgi:type I restriction enzyme, S subunit